jgi:hypothetical protein
LIAQQEGKGKEKKKRVLSPTCPPNYHKQESRGNNTTKMQSKKKKGAKSKLELNKIFARSRELELTGEDVEMKRRRRWNSVQSICRCSDPCCARTVKRRY